MFYYLSFILITDMEWIIWKQVTAVIFFCQFSLSLGFVETEDGDESLLCLKLYKDNFLSGSWCSGTGLQMLAS